MIPRTEDREDHQTLSDLGHSSADSDQKHSNRDQAGSDRDQRAADLDQRAADNDQASSDRNLAHSVDREAYASSRQARERTTQARRETSSERHNTASARDATTHTRDEAHRAKPVTHRADPDRDRAASDRLLMAHDQVMAAEAASEREADEVDLLTGARLLGPGLADLQREIDRANRSNGRLIVAYVDVNGLKATNESKGHDAGDVILKHIVNVLQTNLRSHESVVRLGGDEFVCTISDTTIEYARQRFDEICAELSLTPDQGSISVGLAELVRGDSPMDLIDRADRRLIASRDTQARKSPGWNLTQL